MQRPTLLLLPGLLCDDAVWTHQRLALADLVTCVIPSYGDCSSIADMARAALAAAPAGPLLVAGHSMGGRVALELVRFARERITGLALLDTGTDPLAPGPGGEEERAKRLALLQLARRDGMQAMARQWARGMVHPARLDSGLFEEIVAMVGRSTPEIFEGQIQALLGRPDARATFASIECPTLLLCGRQDTWSPLQRHEQMQRDFPASHLVVVEEAGHMTTMEQPEAVSHALRRWLSAVPRH